MNASGYNSALSQYNKTAVQSSASAADPHRIIQMLLEGALDKIAIAKGAAERKDFQVKGRHINWAIAIIDGLRASLDRDAGGELADNLDSLYEYMSRRLFEANSGNDLEILSEVSGLLREVREAWVAIAPEVNRSEGADNSNMHGSISVGA